MAKAGEGVVPLLHHETARCTHHDIRGLSFGDYTLIASVFEYYWEVSRTNSPGFLASYFWLLWLL